MMNAGTALSKPRGYGYNKILTATEQNSGQPRPAAHSFIPRMAKLDIHLLGEFSLANDDAPLTTVNTPRLQSLVAYLVLNRRAPQSRQRLAFLLWPDSTESQARTNLRNLLFALNKAIPDAEQFLSNDAQSLQWKTDAPYTLDVQEFESAAVQTNSLASLERAAHLYPGELLPGMYDDWIVRERERLDALFTQTLSHLIQGLARNFDYDGALEYARRLVQHDPLREDTYRDLMWLSARRGDRAGVRRAYTDCVNILRRELQVEPSRETQQSYQDALKFEPPPSNAGLATAPTIFIPPRSQNQNPMRAFVPPAYKVRRPIEYAAYGISLVVPLAALVALLLLSVQWYLALGVGALLFIGLFFVFVYRPEVERTRQKIQDEIQIKLEASASKIIQLRELAHRVPNVYVQQSILRICRRADAIQAKLQGDETTTLATASKFEFMLAETRQILENYVRIIHGDISAHTDNITATTLKIEKNLLPALEQALNDFAVLLDRGDFLALDVAIRVLETTLKHEGLI